MTATLKKVLKSIIETADPDKIILFGSRANDNNSSESDYDLLVLKKGIKKRRKLAQKIYLNFHQIGAPIDIIVNELSEYEELQEDSNLIYQTIAQKGIVVYEKK